MRILVTGGAGYVGSHCVKLLCDRGHDVLVLDDLSTGHAAAVDRRAELVVGDIGDGELLGRLIRPGRFDAVMHFAAVLDVAESVREPLKYYRVNVGGSVCLLEAMRQAGVRRMVFSSTCATYGVPQHLPISEDTPQSPINPYGRTKLAVEWALSDCAAAWGLGACSLRYFNAAGAAADGSLGEHREHEVHLIPIALQVALGQRDAIEIYGEDYPTPDGTCVRDYVHVEDLAEAHLLALEALREGKVDHYNVGTGRPASVRQVIEAARQVTGHAIPARAAPRRAGDPPELYADPSRIMKDLNWSPKYTDLRAIIETAWRWHRAHPHGYADAAGRCAAGQTPSAGSPDR